MHSKGNALGCFILPNNSNTRRLAVTVLNETTHFVKDYILFSIVAGAHFRGSINIKAAFCNSIHPMHSLRFAEKCFSGVNSPFRLFVGI